MCTRVQHQTHTSSLVKLRYVGVIARSRGVVVVKWSCGRACVFRKGHRNMPLSKTCHLSPARQVCPHSASTSSDLKGLLLTLSTSLSQQHEQMPEWHKRIRMLNEEQVLQINHKLFFSIHEHIYYMHVLCFLDPKFQACSHLSTEPTIRTFYYHEAVCISYKIHKSL